MKNIDGYRGEVAIALNKVTLARIETGHRLCEYLQELNEGGHEKIERIKDAINRTELVLKTYKVHEASINDALQTIITCQMLLRTRTRGKNRQAIKKQLYNSAAYAAWLVAKIMQGLADDGRIPTFNVNVWSQ